jgi:hypothetical protein
MKKIRATLVVEFKYSNELMNYGDVCDTKIRQVINDASFLPCKLQVAEEFPDNTLPVITEKK